MLIIKLLQSALIKRRKMKYRTIILDPGHAENVAGKRSPDGKYREYKWVREILYQIADKLEEKNVPIIWSCDPEDKNEIGLTKRVKNMNMIAQPAFVFSLHTNAAPGGDTNWIDGARGASIFTSQGLTMSDSFATIIFNNLINDFPDISHWRKDYSDGDLDFEAKFTVLYSVHPSALLEFLFHTSRQDVALLNDESIKKRVVDSLVKSLFQIAQS